MVRARLLVTALAAVVALPAAALAAPAPAAAPTATTTKNVHIRMSDGVDIAANITVPDHGCPCPVILNQSPYRKGDSLGTFWKHGYAEVITDVRGTGSSGGYWDVFGEREQKDGAEVVQWITRQKWSNDRIGLWGPSYMAINQLLTAEQPGTSAVKALFPIVPMSDSYRDVSWSGGAWDSSFMSWWYALVTGTSLAPTDDATDDPQFAFNTETQHLMDVAGFTGQSISGSLLGAYQRSLCDATGQTGPTCAYTDAGYDGPNMRLRSPIDRIDRVKAPAFVIGGSYDIFQRGTPYVYRGLQLPSTKKKLLIGPWYHVAGSGGGNGELPARTTSGVQIPDFGTLAVKWFDHWLKGVDNGIERFPDVTTYVVGQDKWVSDTSFPMRGTSYENLYLSAESAASGATSLHDGALTGRAPAPADLLLPWLPANNTCSRNSFQWSAGLSQTAYTQPTPCETTNAQNEAQALTFTTAPYKKATTLSGPINLHLYVSTPGTNTSLSTVVSDVAPDGTSNPITGGSLVASLRKVTTTKCGSRVEHCSVYGGGDIAAPWHPYTRDSEQPLQPNVVSELQIEVFPTTAYLAPGHRLRLTVMSGDAPHRLDTASTTVGTAGGAGLTRIWVGPGFPSRLYVGVAP